LFFIIQFNGNKKIEPFGDEYTNNSAQQTAVGSTKLVPRSSLMQIALMQRPKSVLRVHMKVLYPKTREMSKKPQNFQPSQPHNGLSN
jgi:hypothetical protein